MSDIDIENVRELLRGVSYPGFSRDIVSAGFIGDIVVTGRTVDLEFKPNTRDEAKIDAMEQAICEVLLNADYEDIQVRRMHPFIQAVPLKSPAELAKEQAQPQGGLSGIENRLMTPLQAEMLEDGELPESDLLAIALGRHDVAQAAGYGPNGPKPLSGPREAIDYDTDIEVLQWSIDPHDPNAETHQQEVKLGNWDYRVWWQVHGSGHLLYVSMQAMNEDWAAHDESAVLHPVGRSEAVNLVFDETRNAVVAIYGTVRDFRPFVKAFGMAYADVRGNTSSASATEEAGDQ